MNFLKSPHESIRREKPDFNVKEYGVKSARELIMKLEPTFQLSDDGKNPRTFFVEKIDTKQGNMSRKTGIVKRRIKNYRIISADDNSGDYFFYMGEINIEFKKDKLEKGTKVDFLVTSNPSDNLDSQNRNGRATDVKVI